MIEFLRAAKLATYASQGDAASVPALLADSKQLEYRQGEWLYRDVYFGMFRFAGQEVVYHQSEPVWSMTYSGGLTQDDARGQAAEIYAFLRQALLQTPVSLPLRGPSVLTVGDKSYGCATVGGVAAFHGTEFIEVAGTKVYELHFSGLRLQ